MLLYDNLRAINPIAFKILYDKSPKVVITDNADDPSF
jgi:hypothetical protein